ncbi:uncharacterized protein LOC123676061 isoform X2 [Harmonia axyridis]|uniref:uncharacterized protein LOC123676061 isoform X2 n=1 Tax=Harmonia axyridis TaxID=115357 RepID=UPI001E276B46|nr:uncharacterized protein LOC123676061 isoform X2 [Harmonia axyridis]
MNPEKPPGYFESNEVPYQPLENNSFAPNTQWPQQPYSQPMPYAPNQYPPVSPYGNMAPNPNQLVFATTIQQPPAPAATTVNVNTGPIQKRYCCSCCCTLFWIIVILVVIAGIQRSV